MIWLLIALVLIALGFKMASLIAIASLWAVGAKASTLAALVAIGVWSVQRMRRRRS